MTAASSRSGGGQRARGWFTAIGAGCVVAGGVVAAIAAGRAGPANGVSEHTAWAVAYLVLVAGAAQVGLGVGQTSLGPGGLPRSLAIAQLAAWNAGNALVIVGTLADTPAAVDVGGAMLAAALVASLRAVAGSKGRRALVWAYRIGVAAVLVSIPIGLVLAHANG